MSDEKLNIKKQSEELDRQSKKFNKYREELKAKCTHTRNGELTLVPSRENGNGNLVYICKQCRKVIRFETLDDARVNNSVADVDRMIDAIKLNANPNNDADAEMLKKLAKTQYYLGKIPSWYKAAIVHGNKRRNNNDNNNRHNDGGSWDKSNIR